MKKRFIVLIAFATILVSMTILTDLYTKNQIDSLIVRTCSNYHPAVLLKEYNYQTKQWEIVKDKNDNYVYRNDVVCPLNLFDLFNHNRRATAGDDYRWEGYYNWKAVIANNPSLVYAALELYGDLIIRQLGSRLSYFAEKGSYHVYHRGVHGYEIDFTKKKFWDANKKSIKQYQKLIDKLLELDDKDLNYFITTNDQSDAASYEFNTWLDNNGLLNSNNIVNALRRPRVQNANEYYCYPGDLLCLTKRVYERHPQWTPRKFLTEAKKFSNKVLEIIEDNN